MSRSILAVIALASLWSVSANITYGDEQMHPLAVGGEWIALSHSESMVASADMCLVSNMIGGLAFRADNNGLEVRVVNTTWTLPADVQGLITIVAGDWSTTVDINSNTDKMIAASIGADIALPMFDAMDKAATMSVTVGKSKPFQVSLKGSTRATNAFKTCAGIKVNSKSPGNNPFN